MPAQCLGDVFLYKLKNSFKYFFVDPSISKVHRNHNQLFCKFQAVTHTY